MLDTPRRKLAHGHPQGREGCARLPARRAVACGVRLRRGEGRLLLLLLIAYGWLFVFFERLNNPNELVRVYAARALAEQGTWSIGTREIQPGRVVDRGPVYSDWGYVNDKALTCDDPRAQPPVCAGRLFAAKAPATSLLGAPVLAAMRLFGPLKKTPAVLALRWICVILPSVAFWILLRRWMLDSGVPETAALACTLAGALGSLSLTYGQMFAGHQMAALALGAAFLCAFWGDFRPFWCGFFCALAVALEYPSAPAAGIVAASALLRHRRGALRLLGGAIPLERVRRALVHSVQPSGESRVRARHRARLHGDLPTDLGARLRLAVLSLARPLLLGALDGPRAPGPTLASSLRPGPLLGGRVFPALPDHPFPLAERLGHRTSLHHPPGPLRCNVHRAPPPRSASPSPHRPRPRRSRNRNHGPSLRRVPGFPARGPEPLARSRLAPALPRLHPTQPAPVPGRPRPLERPPLFRRPRGCDFLPSPPKRAGTRYRGSGHRSAMVSARQPRPRRRALPF